MVQAPAVEVDVAQLHVRVADPPFAFRGEVDADRLAAVQKFYVSQGIVPKEAPLSELFTNQFVQ